MAGENVLDSMAIPAIAMRGSCSLLAPLLQPEVIKTEMTNRAIIIFFILVNFNDCCRLDVYIVDYVYNMHRYKRCCLAA